MSSPASPSPATDQLAGLSLAETAAALRSGELTTTELIAALTRRSAELDHSAANIRSLITLDPAAAEQAAALPRRPPPGAGPLWGIPVAVKDTLDTEGLATTAGSLALAAADPPSRDAACVGRLRAAGALVAAKANPSEWSNFRGYASSSGWSALGGQTRNPYALRRSPGGSSAGSAAAVAAGLVLAAIGSETDGSILCPAACCGVVGVKPTVGRVARTGAIPVSLTQDSLGVLARDVRTAGAVLAAISGPDPGDPASRGAPAPLALVPVQPGAELTALAGARLGVLRSGFAGYSLRTDALVAETLEQLRGVGAVLIDPADVHPGQPEVARPLELPKVDEITMLVHDCRRDLEAYLATRSGGPRSIAEVVAFNTEHRTEELALFGQQLFEQALQVDPADPQYAALHDRVGPPVRAGLDQLFAEHRLDALVLATMGPAWYIDHVNGDSITGSGWSPAAISGYPSMSVPIGLVEGLPVGLAVITRAWTEDLLLRLGLGIEAVRGPLPPPTFTDG